MEVSVSGIRGGYFQAILRDISKRKQDEALLAGEKQLLEMVATGVPLKEILNALCLIIEEQRSGTLASVLLLNPDGRPSGFDCRTESPQGVDPADGKATNWAVCRLLRHRGIPGIKSHRRGHRD